MGRGKLHTEAPTPDNTPDNGAKILQFKIWLKGISPMIWRRVQTPASTTLRELHGIFQVATGWEGVHLFLFNLRAANFGSWQLGGRSPDISLGELQLRRGARFIYKYDLNIPWEHEVRLEVELQLKPGRAYPHCVEGNASCPPEDSRGIADFLAGRDAWVSEEGLAIKIDHGAAHAQQGAGVRQILQPRDRGLRTQFSIGRRQIERHLEHGIAAQQTRVVATFVARADH